jgi:hypothetical protein
MREQQIAQIAQIAPSAQGIAVLDTADDIAYL